MKSSPAGVVESPSWVTWRNLLFILPLPIWAWLLNARLPAAASAVIIVGCILLVLPVVIVARNSLERLPIPERAVSLSALVHVSLMVLLGMAIIEAIKTGQSWRGWMLPIAPVVGLWLARATGALCILTVIELATRGRGAPFAVAISQRLATSGLYRWTRNPMVLATLACLVTVGIWLQSTLFVLWVLALVTPVWIVFVRLFEERELEIRFGIPYLDYRARTPFLLPWPRKQH